MANKFEWKKFVFKSLLIVAGTVLSVFSSELGKYDTKK